MIATTVPRFTKVSAKGKLLAPSAKDWVGVYDSLQQLTWMRRALSGGGRVWTEAVKAAAELDLCGLTGWLLGSRLEWAHLIDDMRYRPALDTDFFTVASNEYWCWTRTECLPAECAWAVSLGVGGTGRSLRSDHSLVRACCPSQISGSSVIALAA